MVCVNTRKSDGIVRIKAILAIMLLSMSPLWGALPKNVTPNKSDVAFFSAGLNENVDIKHLEPVLTGEGYTVSKKYLAGKDSNVNNFFKLAQQKDNYGLILISAHANKGVLAIQDFPSKATAKKALEKWKKDRKNNLANPNIVNHLIVGSHPDKVGNEIRVEYVIR